MRKAKALKLTELAEKANMSTALLSKIENGRIIPTISKLFDLIRVLKIEPQNFFAEIGEEDQLSGYILIRKENYSGYVKEESAVGFDYRSILEYLFDDDISSFQISIVTLKPRNTRPKVSTNAYEFLYIIKGDIKYHLEDRVLHLCEGDSLFFDGNIPHVPINHQDTEAEYLVIYFFQKPTEEHSAE